jgi:hypothetical protein
MKRVKVSIFLVSVLVGFSLAVSAQKRQNQPLLKLTKEQMKTLNRKLPVKVRNFLETAKEFEILTDTVRENVQDPPYIPNWKYVIRDATTRKKVLYTFYRDLALGGNGAACFYPNHSIIARQGRKEVKIVICFTCHEFVVNGAFGNWDGGMDSEPKAEDVLDRLIVKNGARIPPK